MEQQKPPLNGIFGFYWSILPGNNIVKTIITLGVIAGIAYVLVEYGYPWYDSNYNMRDNTVT